MADIYKMDTDYLSAESVYDRTLGKNQNEINAFIGSSTILTSGEQSGTSIFTLASYHIIKYGKIVAVSFRGTLTQSITDATSKTFMSLSNYKPKNVGVMPSFMSIYRGSTLVNASSDVVKIIQSGNTYWVGQGLTGSLNNGDILSFFLVYTID